MRDSHFTYSANISIMFPEYQFWERPAAAAAAGFGHIEMWWPFEAPVVDRDQIDRLLDAIEEAEVRLTGLNFYAGDMPAGERGVAAYPDRAGQLQANSEQLVEIADATGCRHFNLLYGQRDERWSLQEQEDSAMREIRTAAAAVAPLGGTILLEPLAEGLNGAYLLTQPEDVTERITGSLADLDNVRLLFDVFHLGSNGFDVVDRVPEVAEWIGHVQLADSPGRGEPGTGQLPIMESLRALHRSGYTGVVACEYKPTVSTEQSLGWLQRQ